MQRLFEVLPHFFIQEKTMMKAVIITILSAAALLPLSTAGDQAPKSLIDAPKDVHLESSSQRSGSKFTLKTGDEDETAGADEGKVLKVQVKGRKIAPSTEFKTPLKSQDIKVKKDCGDRDRRLNVRRGDGKPAGFVADVVAPTKLRNLIGTKSSSFKKQRENTDKYFMADVAAPIQLENMLAKAAPGSNRRLQTAECYAQDDGSLACIQEDWPGDGFNTVYLNCPTDATIVFDCSSCFILASSGEIDPENDPRCLSCSVCSDETAYDCSNLGEGTCVKRDCNGNCYPGNDPSPTPTPTTPVPSPTSAGSSEGGVECQEGTNGNLYCLLPDYPGDGFMTVFQDCPATLTTALQCGRCDIVAPDDTPTEIDLVNDEKCSSCTVCSDLAAYDCSNLDGGSCSILDCDGNCSGSQTTPPSPTTRPPSPTTRPPSPTTRPPSPTSDPSTSATPSRPNIPFPRGDSSSVSSVSGKGVLSFTAVALGYLFVGFV